MLLSLIYKTSIFFLVKIEDNECKKLDVFLFNSKIKVTTKDKEVNNLIDQPTTSAKAYESSKKNSNTKKVSPRAKKRKEAENVVKIKQEEQEESVNTETVSNETSGIWINYI